MNHWRQYLVCLWSVCVLQAHADPQACKLSVGSWHREFSFNEAAHSQDYHAELHIQQSGDLYFGALYTRAIDMEGEHHVMPLYGECIDNHLALRNGEDDTLINVKADRGRLTMMLSDSTHVYFSPYQTKREAL